MRLFDAVGNKLLMFVVAVRCFRLFVFDGVVVCCRVLVV